MNIATLLSTALSVISVTAKVAPQIIEGGEAAIPKLEKAAADIKALDVGATLQDAEDILTGFGLNPAHVNAALSASATIAAPAKA